MFERYTEEARRSIFFARFEASVFGATAIDTEHLLLGILKADRNLAQTLLTFHITDESVRTKIGQHHPPSGAQVSTSVDLPVSHQSKRVLAYGAEVAERLNRQHIGTEHLLLGLVREDSCFAAQILLEAGLTTAQLIRIGGFYDEKPAPNPQDNAASPPDIFRDLTQAASAGELTPLIGREPELRRTLQILSRRKRNNVAIIGDPGVGKTALIEGFAAHLNAGVIDQFKEHRILRTDAASLFPVKPGSRTTKPADEILSYLPYRGHTLLCIEGLFDLTLARSDWGVTEAWHVLSPHVTAGVQCIATGTPAGLQATIARVPDLARCFEIVSLDPPSPDEAVKILEGWKSKYEQFHGVSFAPGAIEMAVFASGRILPQRSLPDRALDLLDEAAAQVRIRNHNEPPELIALRKEIRQHSRNFEKAAETGDRLGGEYAELERAAKEKLRVLLELRSAPGAQTVTRENIEQVAADRVGAPLPAIRAILAQKGPADLDETLTRLAERIPIERNPWLPLLAAYLTRASDAEIAELMEAIRAARPGAAGSGR